LPSNPKMTTRQAPTGAWVNPGQASLEPDRITATDRATARYGGIHADVDLVMLGGRAQDSRIPREIALRESGHHATPARTGDVQAHGRPDGERVADPGILGKALLARGELDHDVRTKPPNLEPALRIQLTQAIEGGRGQEMDHGNVEECPFREREIGDRVPVVEAVHVRPVLLGIDRAVRGGTKCHLAVERLREDLVEITLVTGDRGAIGEGDPDRRDFRGR